MKNEFVATYGVVAAVAGSVLVAKTLNVAQFPSSFSIRNTLEQEASLAVLQLMFSFEIGIFHGVPLPQQVYSITGLVLHTSELAPQPKKPLSQVSKHFSENSAYCFSMIITFRISEIQLK